jgi:hypothetical protein
MRLRPQFRRRRTASRLPTTTEHGRLLATGSVVFVASNIALTLLVEKTGRWNQNHGGDGNYTMVSGKVQALAFATGCGRSKERRANMSKSCK